MVSYTLTDDAIQEMKQASIRPEQVSAALSDGEVNSLKDTTAHILCGVLTVETVNETVVSVYEGVPKSVNATPHIQNGEVELKCPNCHEIGAINDAKFAKCESCGNEYALEKWFYSTPNSWWLPKFDAATNRGSSSTPFSYDPSQDFYTEPDR